MRTYILCLLLLLVTLLGAGACTSPAPQAAMPDPGAQGAEPDLSTSNESDNGLFTVAYKSDLDPITINELHTWTLHVETAAGEPLDGATVTVDGGMPEHNHGLPTQPLVTPLGGGDYRVEGMKFQMPGQWFVTVVVDAAGQQDTARFNLQLR
jgi:hypothetical protein